MKLVLVTAITFLFSMQIEAQNTQTETKTKTTTVKDSDGTHKTVKTQVIKKDQKVVLGEEKSNTINIPTVNSPVTVTTTTKITNPDGTTRTVDVDRSSYYESNGKIYKLDLDPAGYVITHGEMKPALLRKTSTNSYIFRSENRTAIGYFDTEGNLVVEFYDEKLDIVNIEKYAVIKK
ncbi:hypothetical protein [Flavobacterium facile]|uniref:hypothetical protein n=1 Tax=Flavobacterium facile TaxID=2893174 RepID=UPI002E75F93F|nr:hypothetical protein [Flavobacterium sp. T-12]